MTLHELWDWLNTYDGARTGEAIDLYLHLKDYQSSIGDDDPEVVTDAARHIWIASSIAFMCSYKNGRPIVEGAWEISREKWEETYEPKRQTRTSTLTLENMTSEVYDHLCSELPHFVEEWAVIREALHRRQ